MRSCSRTRSFFKNTYNLKIYKKENCLFSFVAMATRKVRDQRRQVRRHDGYRRTCGYKRCQGSDSGGHGAVASSDSHAATVHGPGAMTHDGSARSAWPGRAGGRMTNGHGQGMRSKRARKAGDMDRREA